MLDRKLNLLLTDYVIELLSSFMTDTWNAGNVLVENNSSDQSIYTRVLIFYIVEKVSKVSHWEIYEACYYTDGIIMFATILPPNPKTLVSRKLPVESCE